MRTRILAAVVLSLLLSPVLSARAAAPYSQGKVLVQGDPALTETMLEKYGDFFEWLFETKMSAQERQKFRGIVTAHWQAKDTEDIQSAVQTLETFQQVEAHKPLERELYREKMLEEAMPAMREQARKDAEVRWLMSLYDRAHVPLAKGNPPLTRQLAEARTEYICFVLVNAGLLPGEPDAAYKDALTRKLVEQYPGLSSEEQQEIGKAQWTWTVLQLTWAQLPEADKRKARQEWTEAAQAQMSEPQKRALAAMKELRQLLAGLDGRKPDARKGVKVAEQLERLAQGLREDEENRELADGLARTAQSLRAAVQPAPAASGGGDEKWLRDEMTDAQWAAYQRMTPQQQKDERYRLVMARATRQHDMSMWTGAHVMNNISWMTGSSTRYTVGGWTP